MTIHHWWRIEFSFHMLVLSIRAVSVVDGVASDRCRYELIVRAADTPEIAEFYFDYELLSGRVTVGLPPELGAD